MNFITTFTNAYREPDIRKRINFVFLMFFVFVLGSHVPVPGTNPEALQRLFDVGGGGGILNILDIFSGGSLKRISVLALGIMPYINASIIFNLLVVVFPQLQELQKEGEAGRRKIGQWTKYLTVFLATVQAMGMLLIFSGQRGSGGGDILINPTLFNKFFIVLTLTAGTCFLMWMGELITEHGIGNGVSLVIFAGIISRLPLQFAIDIQQALDKNEVVKVIIIFAIIFVAMIAFVVFMHMAERRITIKYARPGRYATPTHYLPLKVNMAGVIPIIFAVSVLLFPATVAGFIPNEATRNWANYFTGSWLYYLLYFLLTVLFTFFYTAVVFNPTEVADNLKKNGGYIPGIRPGKPTAEYLSRVLERLTFVGALYLAFVATGPSALIQGLGTLQTLDVVAGTSVLIVVGVALDTVRELEARLTMMRYERVLR